MRLLNRSAAIVRPRPPFIEWANTIDEDGPEFLPGTSAYLIPECDSEAELQAFLGANYRRIAEEEFSAWCADPATWPRMDSYTRFREWFAVEHVDLVSDLGATKLSADAE